MKVVKKAQVKRLKASEPKQRCPNCGRGAFGVVRGLTPDKDIKWNIKRARVCDSCRHKEPTVEITEAMLQHYKDSERALLTMMRIQAEHAPLVRPDNDDE